MTPPTSREPGQADATLEADITAFRTEMKRWNKPLRTAALTLRIIADRTRYRERIKKLEKALPDPGLLDILAQWLDERDAEIGRVGRDEVQQDLRRWAANARALLEVPDAE